MLTRPSVLEKSLTMDGDHNTMADIYRVDIENAMKEYDKTFPITGSANLAKRFNVFNIVDSNVLEKPREVSSREFKCYLCMGRGAYPGLVGGCTFNDNEKNVIFEALSWAAISTFPNTVYLTSKYDKQGNPIDCYDGVIPKTFIWKKKLAKKNVGQLRKLHNMHWILKFENNAMNLSLQHRNGEFFDTVSSQFTEEETTLVDQVVISKNEKLQLFSEYLLFEYFGYK